MVTMVHLKSVLMAPEPSQSHGLEAQGHVPPPKIFSWFNWAIVSLFNENLRSNGFLFFMVPPHYHYETILYLIRKKSQQI